MTQRAPVALHVVEAYGGGVKAAIENWADASPEYRHVVLKADRANHLFAKAGRGRGVGFIDMPPKHRQRVLSVETEAARVKADIIHAHSSLAGIYSRLARTPDIPIAYSPHCFAFERTDIGSTKRRSFWMAEAALARRTSIFITVSEHEAQLALRLPGARCAEVLRVTSETEVRRRPAQSSRPNRIRLLSVGRLCAQKDPYFVAAALQELRHRGVPFEHTWVGDGDVDMRAALESSGSRVAGWQSEDEVIRQMDAADAFLHSAAWEGSPVTTEEALRCGLPVIARSLPVLRQMNLVGLVESPSEMATAVERLAEGDLKLAALTSQAVFERHVRQHPARLTDLYDQVRSSHK
ncbi:glycosyltransferase [Nocardioides nanhaiensis]